MASQAGETKMSTLQPPVSAAARRMSVYASTKFWRSRSTMGGPAVREGRERGGGLKTAAFEPARQFSAAQTPGSAESPNYPIISQNNQVRGAYTQAGARGQRARVDFGPCRSGKPRAQ